MTIFVCYARADKRLVKTRIVDRLVIAGKSVFYDANLMPGLDWQQQLDDEIKRCDFFIYASSPAAATSEWCQWELGKAIAYQKRIIPVLIRDGELPESLRSIQWVDFTKGSTDDAVASLTRGVLCLSSENSSLDPINPTGDPPQATTSHPPWWRTERGWFFAFGFVGTIAGVIAAFFAAADFLSRAPSLTPATTVANITETSAPILAPTDSMTATRDAIGASTGTAISSATPTPIATWDPTIHVFNEVTQNADWMPIESHFDGVAMVLVPAGCFDMGSDEHAQDARPSHEICFGHPFWIDRYEVRNSDFEAVVGIVKTPSGDLGENNPRTNATWMEAREFCELRNARLPTESEWEYAARGPDGLLHPWGNDWEPDYTVWDENSDDKTVHVESYPEGASWVGAFHLNGNVWERVSSLLDDYPYESSDGRENPDENAGERVFRGGAIDQREDAVNSVTRFAGPSDGWYYNLGFRCARDFSND